jgi:hypothetical protein
VHSVWRSPDLKAQGDVADLWRRSPVELGLVASLPRPGGNMTVITEELAPSHALPLRPSDVGYHTAELCITAKMRPDVSCGSRLCENPEVAKKRRKKKRHDGMLPARDDRRPDPRGPAREPEPSGQQKVTVEHVHVHAGGQAVVGVVEGPVG